MITSDDTQLMGKRPEGGKENVEKQEEQTNGGNRWKTVAIGAGTGILMGAGTAFAASTLHGKDDEPITAGDIKEAHASDGDSFEDAFNAARAQVGPGGVFEWHGNLYNTYTKEEWDSMSDDEKNAFADAVRPMAQATEADHQAAQHVEAHTVHHEPTAEDVRPVGNTHEQPAGGTTPAANTQGDDDVHVVGQTTVGGHGTLIFDVDGDNQADVAVIDVNDNNVVDVEDVVVDTAGNVVTMGELQAQVETMDDGSVAVSNETDVVTAAPDPVEETSYDPNMDPNMQQALYGDDGGISGMDGGLDDGGLGDDGSGLA